MIRAALVAALLALAPVPALAGPTCGSSGGGGGGASSSSDDSSSSSSDASSTTTTPACVDTDDVVGYRQCRRFGSWAGTMHVPHAFVSVGVAMRQSPTLAVGKTGHVAHGQESFSFRTVETEGGPSAETSVLSMIRLGVGLPGPFYVAVDAELGGLADVGRNTVEMTSSGELGTPEVTARRGFAVNALGALGARASTRFGSVGVELAGGVRALHYSVESRYHACETETTMSGVGSLLEARATFERWLNPWINVGAIVGGSVLDRGAWITGVYLGVHSRAFAGER